MIRYNICDTSLTEVIESLERGVNVSLKFVTCDIALLVIRADYKKTLIESIINSYQSRVERVEATSVTCYLGLFRVQTVSIIGA